MRMVFLLVARGRAYRAFLGAPAAAGWSAPHRRQVESVGKEARALGHDCEVSDALAPDVAIAPVAHAIERRAVALRKMHVDAVC